MTDKKFRIPRIWSNNEIKKFAHFFSGKVVNVSGWMDMDKQGATYREYFSNANEYWITNYKSEARGYQGDIENEIFLDLSVPIDGGLDGNFDVVFNHTVLEHIFEIDIAFANLCNLSNDIVMIVVPFMQEQHADYGDYWRFTPLAVEKLFKKNGLEMIYISFNDNKDSSIYVFSIGSKLPERWEKIKQQDGNRVEVITHPESYLGKKVFTESMVRKTLSKVKRLFR